MTTVFYAIGGCGVLLLLLLALLVWDDLHPPEVRHPLDDDLPHWW